MKGYKKLISLALALALVFTCALPAFAEGGSETAQYKNFVMIGDSVACGSELKGSGWFECVELAFPAHVAKAVGAYPYCPLTFAGARVEDVLYLLGDYDDGYEENAEEYFEFTTGEAFNYIKKVASGNWSVTGDPTERVAEADLIGIELGNNNVGFCPINLAQRYQAELIAEGMSEAEAMARMIPYYLQKLNDEMNEMLRLYPKLLEKIRGINPNATVFMVGLYNPFWSTSLFEGNSEIALGKAASAIIQSVNAKMRAWAERYGAVFVDVHDLSYCFPVSTLSTFDDIRYSTHPDAEGHKYIAQQIINALSNNETRVYIPREGDMRIELGGIDVGTLSFDKNIFSYKISDGVNGKLCIKEGALSRSENGGLWWYDGGFFTISKVKIDTRFGFSYLSFAKEYLTADDGGALALSNSRTNAAMFVGN